MADQRAGDKIYGVSLNGVHFEVWEGTIDGDDIDVEVTPNTQAHLPIIGGGARVVSTGPGNLLTACFPSPGGGSWMARAMEYHDPSVGTMRVRCITATVPSDTLYVAEGIDTAERGIASAIARLPAEYALIGGGAQIFFDEPRWPGSLLVGSWPGKEDQWNAAASASLASSPSPVAVASYAIGLSRAFLKDNGLRVVRHQHDLTGHAANHPGVGCNLSGQLGAHGFITGGGAVTSNGGEPNALSFLTETFPSTPAPHDLGWGWHGASKDHLGAAAPGWIRAYALGLRTVHA
jgi:hypothetical protein